MLLDLARRKHHDRLVDCHSDVVLRKYLAGCLEVVD